MGLGGALQEGAAEGMAPRAVRHLFTAIDAARAAPGAGDRTFSVSVACLEIHNEELRDLLAAPGVPPKVGGGGRGARGGTWERACPPKTRGPAL